MASVNGKLPYSWRFGSSVVALLCWPRAADLRCVKARPDLSSSRVTLPQYHINCGHSADRSPCHLRPGLWLSPLFKGVLGRLPKNVSEADASSSSASRILPGWCDQTPKGGGSVVTALALTATRSRPNQGRRFAPTFYGTTESRALTRYGSEGENAGGA